MVHVAYAPDVSSDGADCWLRVQMQMRMRMRLRHDRAEFVPASSPQIDNVASLRVTSGE